VSARSSTSAWRSSWFAPEGFLEKAGHARTPIGAAGQLFGDCVEIIGRGFDARIALNQLENIQEIGAHVMQLRLGAFAGSDAVERALDEA
jgi:hypothetical protein